MFFCRVALSNNEKNIVMFIKNGYCVLGQWSPFVSGFKFKRINVITPYINIGSPTIYSMYFILG